MSAWSCYLGTNDLEGLRALNDKLNARVVEQVNDAQELVMLNNFAHESNEYHFKKCLQDRMSDIASWRWVLEDLTKRLTDAAEALYYEHNALRVVIGRLQKQIDQFSRDGSKPGALSPLTDCVEEAILKEHNFLRDEKKKFEMMVQALEKQTNCIEQTKTKIATDIFNKKQALNVDEGCARITANTQCRGPCARNKKKKAFSVSRWEKRCVALKTAGLRALRMAIFTRQEVRGARVHLSIAAQAYATRVESALRRRLNTNKIKLQDIYWQKEETWRDFENLKEELTATEQNIEETMEQERVIEARIADRARRPGREHTKDEVDRQLRDELARLRNFSKHLRDNHASISSDSDVSDYIKSPVTATAKTVVPSKSKKPTKRKAPSTVVEESSNLLAMIDDSLARIDSCAADLLRVIHLDDDRITSRLGEPSTGVPQPPPSPAECPERCQTQEPSPQRTCQEELHVIKEEDEKDDDDDEDEPYPLDH